MTASTRNESGEGRETLYTCKITILRVTDVPVADFNDLACDPYIEATLSVDNTRDASEPQLLTYRTHTCRRTLNPEFNADWVVAGIPASGFILSCRLRDEDPGNYVLTRLPPEEIAFWKDQGVDLVLRELEKVAKMQAPP